MPPSSSSTERLDYYGVKPCGCATAWMSGECATAAEGRKFERDMEKTGRRVERAPFDRDRIMVGTDCTHTPERAKALEDENARLRAELEALRHGS